MKNFLLESPFGENNGSGLPFTYENTSGVLSTIQLVEFDVYKLIKTGGFEVINTK